MIEYIKGTIAGLTPTEVVIDNAGIGHVMEISLQTYSKLEGRTEATIYIQSQVNQRDGITVDYGFADRDERELFRLITSVSGMGAGTARMVLSSFTADELRDAILGEDVNRIKSVKGIGLKGAQRMILELKDKIVKGGTATDTSALFQSSNSEAIDEATRALIMLGYSKPNVNKVIQNIIKKNPTARVEDLIKSALQIL